MPRCVFPGITCEPDVLEEKLRIERCKVLGRHVLEQPHQIRPVCILDDLYGTFDFGAVFAGAFEQGFSGLPPCRGRRDHETQCIEGDESERMHAGSSVMRLAWDEMTGRS